ncbi:hypothetical protein INS49_009334 [Diaporthe citri]|uniref:uncharacterized protein n=1 Tax=Diaporthe citri TaxID=83186 RepID=UPI001C7E252B|nr:uncharacterized protein INS49_009334 [Diaporthe citri]KAG6361110.1 hypothetical protein INS49_009334 [Diaporthe citri]
MPRDRRDELGEAPRAVHGSEREGSYGQQAPDSYVARRRTRSRSRSPRRRPAAEDFYRERTPERHDTQSNSHHDRHRRHRHHSRDAASRSPNPGDDRKRHHHRHHHRRHRTKPTASTTARETPADLPSGARPLSYKHDLDAFTPLFAYYLDVQKNLDFYELDSQQARGRWKSFVNKWNRGELAEGWYDPEMFERISREAPPPAARTSAARQGDARVRERGQSTPSRGASPPNGDAGRAMDNDDSDSDYGPPPPPGQSDQTAGGARKGPGIPTLSDLALQREAASEERESQLSNLRNARKADRAQQKERLEELAPRAEPGTRERRLEKKAAVNEKMKGFREGAGDGAEEVGDGDLMGGGDSVAELKRAKESMQRKKTERELRREAEARAREEERLERLREWREREDEKLRGLKELARARFG